MSVSVGNAHAIWAIDLQERALRWSDGAWVVVQEGIRELDVGSDGELWAVGAEDRLYRWEPGSGFLVEPGRLRTIAVGHAHYVAGATADDQLFSRRGCSWQHHDVRMVPKLPTLTGIEVRRHQLLGVSLACLEIGWRLRLDRDYGDMLEQAAETGHPVVIGLPLGGIRDREHRPRLEMKADDFEFGRAVDVEGLPFVLRHRLRLVHDICELWGLKLLATHERKSQEESESPELPPIWARLRWPGGSATVPES